MIKSTWKPAGEIRRSLGGARSVTIISCGTCANLSGTGGREGIRFLERLCDEWGVRVVASLCLAACCPEDAMRQSLRRHRRRISRSDVLLMLSCSGGVKSAFLCRPGTPVVAALDTVGSVPVSLSDDPVARSTCSYCEHCVLTFTGGICPLGECPSKRQYSPCNKYPPEGGKCPVDPGTDCVWVEIEKRGDLAALKELEGLHRSGEHERPGPALSRHSPPFLRKLSGWFVAHVPGWSRLSRLIH